MTNTTIKNIYIDGVKTVVNQVITEYNTEQEIEGYPITTIEYQDYLIIFSKDPHVTSISFSSTDYPHIIFNSYMYALGCKTEKVYKLYENNITISGLKIFGHNDETSANNFQRPSSKRFCMYLQSTPEYTYYKMDMAPIVKFLYRNAVDPVVGLVFLAIQVKKYSHTIFYVEDNYLYAKFITNILTWSELTNTEAQGTVPIITGGNNGNVKGFFSKNSRQVQYWHDAFDAANILDNIGATCVDIDIEQILSNNPAWKPTVILSYDDQENTVEFEYDQTDPQIRYVTQCNAATSDGFDWPALEPNKSKVFYKDCDEEGYYKTLTRYCNFGGNLTTAKASSCQIKKCPANNGFPITSVGNEASKDCESGFTGNITRKCVNTVGQPYGTWENEVRNCTAIPAPTPTGPETEDEDPDPPTGGAGSGAGSGNGGSGGDDPTGGNGGDEEDPEGDDTEGKDPDKDEKIYCEKDGDWVKTLANKTVTIQCGEKYPSELKKTRKCGADGKWEKVDDSKCVIEETSYLWLWIIVAVAVVILIVIIVAFSGSGGGSVKVVRSVGY